jgi:hypothetical protein
MPYTYRQVIQDVPVGFRCDRCGDETDLNSGHFELRHTCGYGSPLDGTEIRAVLCDICIARWAVTLPGATFTTESGEIARSDMRKRVMEIRPPQKRRSESIVDDRQLPMFSESIANNG